MTTLHISIPDELLGSMSEQQLESLAQEALLVRLYDLGEISFSWGAQALGIARREFLDLLGTYGVSIFDDQAHITLEAAL